MRKRLYIFRDGEGVWHRVYSHPATDSAAGRLTIPARTKAGEAAALAQKSWPEYQIGIGSSCIGLNCEQEFGPIIWLKYPYVKENSSQ